MGAFVSRPPVPETEPMAEEPEEAPECYIGPNGFVILTNNSANRWVDQEGIVHDANDGNREVGKVVVGTVMTPDGAEYMLAKCNNLYVCESVGAMLYRINRSGDDIVFVPFEYDEDEDRLCAVPYRPNCTNLQWLLTKFTMTVTLRLQYQH